MKYATMLYKYPGSVALQDGAYETLIVDADEVESALKDGWSRTPEDARAPKTQKSVKTKSKEE